MSIKKKGGFCNTNGKIKDTNFLWKSMTRRVLGQVISPSLRTFFPGISRFSLRQD